MKVKEKIYEVTYWAFGLMLSYVEQSTSIALARRFNKSYIYKIIHNGV